MSRRQTDTNRREHDAEFLNEEDSENEDDVLIPSATLTDPRFQIPDHAQGREITRKFLIQFDNSLSNLAARPSAAKWKPENGRFDIFQTRTRYAPNCQRSERRRGNLEQTLLIGMKIKKIDSTFPCQLGFSVKGCRGNYYTSSGEQFAYIISANEKNHNLDEIIVCTNPYVNSEYLSRFPGMSAQSLRTEGIMTIPNENYVFVDKSHPLIDMIRENAELLHIDLEGATLLENRWFKIDKEVADRCLNDLERELITNLPLFDFTDFSANITRPFFLDFDDGSEVLENVSSQNTQIKNKILNQQNHLSVVLEISYLFM